MMASEEEQQLRRSFFDELTALKPNHRAVKHFVNKVIKAFKICVFSFEYFDEVNKVRKLLGEHGLDFYEVFIGIESELESLFADVLSLKCVSTPKINVFVNSYHVTDYNKLVKLIRIGRIYDLLEGDHREYDFDLIVVGGGPGGIAAAMEASAVDCSVAIFDFVKKSERGCRWGVGGTCLNIGCVPRNIFCHAALMRENIRDSSKFGWENTEKSNSVDFSWSTLVSTVHNYINSQNEQITDMFQMKGITYHNKIVTFIDKHTIRAAASEDLSKCCAFTYTAQNFVVATGLIPSVPDFPGSKYVITTRDLFHIKDNPKKILIIGSSLTCLECAGFLSVLHVDVTVCSETNLLERFDRNCVERVVQHLSCLGVKFYIGYKVESVEKLEEEDIIGYEYLVKMRNLDSEPNGLPYFFIEEFAVVFAAIGRVSTAKQLNIERLGVKMTNDKANKIIVNKMNQTDCRTIYAVGDVAADHYYPSSYMLTRKTASSVVRNLVLGTQFTVDRRLVPMVLHTPINYGCVGMSEEAALDQFGVVNINIYEGELVPIDWQICRKMVGTSCYAKVVCKTDENDKIIGLHFVGTNASEVLPSFALAVKMGCTKKQLDSMLGITTRSTAVDGTDFGSVGDGETEQPLTPESSLSDQPGEEPATRSNQDIVNNELTNTDSAYQPLSETDGVKLDKEAPDKKSENITKALHESGEVVEGLGMIGKSEDVGDLRIIDGEFITEISMVNENFKMDVVTEIENRLLLSNVVEDYVNGSEVTHLNTENSLPILDEVNSELRTELPLPFDKHDASNNSIVTNNDHHSPEVQVIELPSIEGKAEIENVGQHSNSSTDLIVENSTPFIEINGEKGNDLSQRTVEASVITVDGNDSMVSNNQQSSDLQVRALPKLMKEESKLESRESNEKQEPIKSTETHVKDGSLLNVIDEKIEDENDSIDEVTLHPPNFSRIQTGSKFQDNKSDSSEKQNLSTHWVPFNWIDDTKKLGKDNVDSINIYQANKEARRPKFNSINPLYNDQTNKNMSNSHNLTSQKPSSVVNLIFYLNLYDKGSQPRPFIYKSLKNRSYLPAQHAYSKKIISKKANNYHKKGIVSSNERKYARKKYGRSHVDIPHKKGLTLTHAGKYARKMHGRSHLNHPHNKGPTPKLKKIILIGKYF